MSEMVEKVARAMAEKSKARQPGMHTLNSLPMDGKEDFLEMARAAIEAMRETTPQMRVAVRQAGGPQALAYANAAWPTMIDAALKD